jgi:hypothetical protein
MKKRQKKKLARYCCPKCRARDGFFYHYQIKSGRWMPIIVKCFDCDCPPIDIDSEVFKSIARYSERNENEKT